MNKTQIQYQTLYFEKEEQSNRNEPPTSENRNTTQSNNKEKTLTQKQNKFRKFNENYKWTKDCLATSRKLRIENNQDGNRKVFANGPGDRGSIQKLQKMVLDAALLNTQHYKVSIKGKVEQSRERSSALPLHHGVVAIEKRSFGSPSANVPNFTFIDIHTNKNNNRIKWTNLCKSKINLWETQGSRKEHQ